MNSFRRGCFGSEPRAFEGDRDRDAYASQIVLATEVLDHCSLQHVQACALAVRLPANLAPHRAAGSMTDAFWKGMAHLAC